MFEHCPFTCQRLTVSFPRGTNGEEEPFGCCCCRYKMLVLGLRLYTH